MTGKLAVIVPVRNGGALLHSTVLSCGTSTLSGSQAEVIVVDNCSDDGAVDTLPHALPNGIAIRVIRNERDLGRVGNWNRGVQAARELGFEFATFLFVGDTWIAGGAAERLLSLMHEHNADLGLAAFRIVDEQGAVLRESARISFDGDTKVIAARDFAAAMLARGHMPVTPLQANFYRLREDRLPLFAEAQPLTTDMDATVQYLAASKGPVVIAREAVCAWLSRKGRVFCTSGLEPFIADHFRQLRHAQNVTGARVDWTKAKSVFFVGFLRSAWTFLGWRGLPSTFVSVRRHMSAEPGTLDPFDMTSLVLRHVLFRRSSLHLT
jgi:hypothetical protein